jgi:anaerobic magnesium-protoporphyrin IX monomethyl ester cyclase
MGNMRILLISGFGPYYVNSHSYNGTLLNSSVAPELQQTYTRIAGQPIKLSKLHYGGELGYPVLRPVRGKLHHLTTSTLLSIIQTKDVECELFDLENIWSGKHEPIDTNFDVVILSTSYICDSATLDRALNWIIARFPAATFIVGGQFSNLKYADILQYYPGVDYVLRGDGEVSLPKLIDVLQGKGDLNNVPNLVARGSSKDQIVLNEMQYIDLNECPLPKFSGSYSIVPYESVRGCVFGCKFCSFPLGSPKWRYKSAEKICSDWTTYAQDYGAKIIDCKDSTFTVPPKRFNRLLELLPKVGIGWYGYTRANVMKNPEVVEKLEATHCRSLTIGFESMSEATLKYINKGVTPSQNYRASKLLYDSGIALRSFFMVGFPGETPENYEKTHRFIVEEVEKRFALNVFLLVDEKMPIWNEAHIYEIEMYGDNTWKHIGMDYQTGVQLREQTLLEARWKNENGVFFDWQYLYEDPLIPDLDARSNYRVEKLIERLAFLVKDVGENQLAVSRCHSILQELRDLGVELN